MLLSYVLVLCLILDDFNLEYTKLRKDLYMSQIKYVSRGDTDSFILLYIILFCPLNMKKSIMSS